MRLSLKLSLLLVVLAIAAPPLLFSQEPIPRLASVEPLSGKVGIEIAITGENIGKDTVAELYFTDGKTDIKVSMSEQSETIIKCKVPASVKTGIRYKLMILTKGKEPKLIEQPVRFEVEE